MSRVQRWPVSTKSLRIVVLWTPVMRDTERTEFPSTRAAKTASFVSGFSTFTAGSFCSPESPRKRYTLVRRHSLDPDLLLRGVSGLGVRGVISTAHPIWNWRPGPDLNGRP